MFFCIVILSIFAEVDVGNAFGHLFIFPTENLRYSFPPNISPFGLDTFLVARQRFIPFSLFSEGLIGARTRFLNLSSRRFHFNFIFSFKLFVPARARHCLIASQKLRRAWKSSNIPPFSSNPLKCDAVENPQLWSFDIRLSSENFHAEKTSKKTSQILPRSCQILINIPY